jgi:hypothetical protein
MHIDGDKQGRQLYAHCMNENETKRKHDVETLFNNSTTIERSRIRERDESRAKDYSDAQRRYCNRMEEVLKRE